MNKLKELYLKHKEIILYVFFGALTTLVSIVTFWAFDLVLTTKLHLLSNLLSWIVTVIFAFVMNKLFVFESKSWCGATVAREAAEFLGARLFGLAIEELGMLLLVDALGFKDIALDLLGFTVSGALIAKAILSVVVIILNYFFSKFIIFKGKK